MLRKGDVDRGLKRLLFGDIDRFVHDREALKQREQDCRRREAMLRKQQRRQVSSAAAAQRKHMEVGVRILALTSPSLEPLRAYVGLNSGALC